MMTRLLQVARDEKITRISADILTENHPMQHVCEKLGFKLRSVNGEDVVSAEIYL